MARYEIRRRNRWTLVVLEIVILSITVPHWLDKKWHWDTFTSITAGIGTAVVLLGLFFGLRIFRYLFSILFSLFWGFLAYMFADTASRSEITPWIAALLAVLISLFLHKNYFSFEKEHFRE